MEAFIHDAVLEEKTDLPAGYEGVCERTLLEGDEAAAGQPLQPEWGLESAHVDVAESRQPGESQVDVGPVYAASGEIIFGLEPDVPVQRAAQVDAAAAEEDAVQGFIRIAFFIHEKGIFYFVTRTDEVPVVLDAPTDPNLDIVVQGTEPQAVSPQRLHAPRLVRLRRFFQALNPLFKAHLGLSRRACAQNAKERQTQRQPANSQPPFHSSLPFRQHARSQRHDPCSNSLAPEGGSTQTRRGVWEEDTRPASRKRFAQWSPWTFWPQCTGLSLILDWQDVGFVLRVDFPVFRVINECHNKCLEFCNSRPPCGLAKPRRNDSRKPAAPTVGFCVLRRVPWKAVLSGKHPQVDAAAVQFFDRRHQMLQVAPQAVELPDVERVARPQGLQAGLEARAVL